MTLSRTCTVKKGGLVSPYPTTHAPHPGINATVRTIGHAIGLRLHGRPWTRTQWDAPRTHGVEAPKDMPNYSDSCVRGAGGERTVPAFPYSISCSIDLILTPMQLRRSGLYTCLTRLLAPPGCHNITKHCTAQHGKHTIQHHATQHNTTQHCTA